MSKRLKYVQAHSSLQQAHTKIHQALCAFKTEPSDVTVTAKMLEAYEQLTEALKAMGYKP
ncbi:hypothetical protein H6G64_30140 [Calothrix sp. FACHB-156]|nr:hypothetical protein [Calothrix sp. FACHB-156]